jgi:hypothetical protein
MEFMLKLVIGIYFFALSFAMLGMVFGVIDMIFNNKITRSMNRWYERKFGE